MSVKPTAQSVKLTVGLEMLGETKGIGEYDAANTLLSKILGNIVKAPDEPKVTCSPFPTARTLEHPPFVDAT